MDNLLIQIILAARSNEGDDTFWMQILVLVILAGSFGIVSVAKAKANKFKEQNDPAYPQKSKYQRHWQIQPSPGHSKSSSLSVSMVEPKVNKRKTAKQPMLNFYNPAKTSRARPKRKLVKEKEKQKEKDLNSGMELLELNFLLSTVENTDGDDEKDIIIRKLNFKELLRRGELNRADSNALKIYALNKNNHYGKDIQCEAMKNLAERTAAGIKK